MRYEAFYVIRPTSALLDRLIKDEIKIQDLLSMPRILAKQQGGRSVWHLADHLESIKVVFLANLVAELANPAVVRELFGVLPIPVGVFDRWWTIEVVVEFDRVEEVTARLGRERIGVIAAIRPVVADWLATEIP